MTVAQVKDDYVETSTIPASRLYSGPGRRTRTTVVASYRKLRVLIQGRLASYILYVAEKFVSSNREKFCIVEATIGSARRESRTIVLAANV